MGFREDFKPGKARELESEASEYDHEQNIDDVVTDTKLSYYRAVIAMNNTKAIRKEVEKNDLLLAKARELFKSGRSSNISLTEANSNLAESKLKLTNAENIEEARRGTSGRSSIILMNRSKRHIITVSHLKSSRPS